MLLAVPAAAEEITPDQNLDCAAWAVYQMGVAPSGEVSDAFSVAFAWFSGLYEGQTGQTIDAPLMARTREIDRLTINSLSDGCLARFTLFAERLSKLATDNPPSGK